MKQCANVLLSIPESRTTQSFSPVAQLLFQNFFTNTNSSAPHSKISALEENLRICEGNWLVSKRINMANTSLLLCSGSKLCSFAHYVLVVHPKAPKATTIQKKLEVRSMGPTNIISFHINWCFIPVTINKTSIDCTKHYKRNRLVDGKCTHLFGNSCGATAML